MTEMKQQSHNGDQRIADLFIRTSFSDLISCFAAVPVDAKAHIVDELLFNVFDFYCRQIDEIFIEQDLFARFFVDVIDKIIAGTVRKQIDIVFQF